MFLSQGCVCPGCRGHFESSEVLGVFLYPAGGTSEDNPNHATAKALREGAVQLTSLSTLLSYHRYFFLFNDVLIISKQKGPGSFKLKEKLRLEHVWVASSNTTDSFLIGWPVNNFLVHFRSKQERDDWFSLFTLHVQRALRPYTSTLPMEINVRGRKQVIRRRVENGKKAGELVVETIEDLGLLSNTIYELRFVLDDSGGKVLQGPECVYAVIMAELEKAGYKLSESQRASLDTCALVSTRLVLSDLNSAKTPSPLHIVNSFRKKVLSRTDSRGIFGRELEGSTPPQPILTIIDYLRIHGLEVEGLFRKSPKQSTFKELKAELDHGLVPNFHRYNIHVVASLLKDYLRSIPGKILLNGNYELWMREVVDEPNLDKKLDACRSLLTLLPSSHSILLANLLKLLTKIASSPGSKMSATSLSVCLAPSFLESRDVMEDGRKIPALVEFLIRHAADVLPGFTRDGLFPSCDLNANFLSNTPQPSSTAGDYEGDAEEEEDIEDEEDLPVILEETGILTPEPTTIIRESPIHSMARNDEDVIYKTPLKPTSSLRIEEIEEEPEIQKVVKSPEPVKAQAKKEDEEIRAVPVVVPMPFKTIVKPPKEKRMSMEDTVIAKPLETETKALEPPRESIFKRLEREREEEKRREEEERKKRLEDEARRKREEAEKIEREKRLEREKLEREEKARKVQEEREQEQRLQLALEVRAFFEKPPTFLVHKESLEVSNKNFGFPSTKQLKEKINLAERIARLRHVTGPFEKEEEVPEDPPSRVPDAVTDSEDDDDCVRPLLKKDFTRSPRHAPKYTPHLQRSASFALPTAAALQRTASLKARTTESVQSGENEERQRKWEHLLSRRDSKNDPRCVGLGQIEINWSVRQLKERFQDSGEAPQIQTDYLNPCLDRLIS